MIGAKYTISRKSIGKSCFRGPGPGTTGILTNSLAKLIGGVLACVKLVRNTGFE